MMQSRSNIDQVPRWSGIDCAAHDGAALHPRPRTKQKAARRRLFCFGWGRGITRIIPDTRPSGLPHCLRSHSKFAPGEFVEPSRAMRDRGSHPSTQSRNEKPATRAGFFILAGGEGFEPPLAESESAVLPLDDPPAEACANPYEYGRSAI